MKKRKKIIFDIYDNIIKTEDKLNKFNDINFKYDIDFIKKFNFNYKYDNLTNLNKNIFNNLVKNKYFINNLDNINLFLEKNKIINQITYFFNKYDNFAKKYIFDYEYSIGKHGIYNYKDFIMLIKDMDCVPFWNDKCKELSKQIFMPIQKNIEKIEPYETFNYSNWFKTEHYIDSSDLNNNNLIIDKQRNFIEKVKNIKSGKMEKIIKCKKIKLYLTTRQKSCIKQLLGAYRYFYNRTVDFINNYDKKTKKSFYYIDYHNKKSKIEIDLKNEKYLFTFFTIQRLLKDNYPEWINNFDMPSHLIDRAFKEASENYQKCLTKLNKKQIYYFKLGFKIKKDKYQTMNIESTMIKSDSNSLFYNLSDNLKYENKYVFRNLKSSSPFNEFKNICDSSITFNLGTNEYYLNLNYNDKQIHDKTILNNKKICSIDPGIKSFLTIYSHDSVDKIGVGIRDKMKKICRDIDIIVSKQNTKVTDENNKKTKYKYNHEKRRNLRKALHRKIKYLDNLKKEMHNKSIKFLSDRFGKIIIPPFETQKMVSNKKIDFRTSRSLMNLSYYKFLQKLKNRCLEYDIELVIRPEYYTSKTCTKCGNIKHDLKNQDVYNCKECGLKIDRDTNGARNILLRNLCN